MERFGCDRFAFSVSKRLFVVHCVVQDVRLADKLPHYLGRGRCALPCTLRPWRISVLNLHAPSDRFGGRSRAGLGDHRLHQGRTMGNRFGRLITSQGPSSYPTTMLRKTSVPPLTHSTKSVPVLGNRQRAFAPLKHARCFGRGDEGPQSRKSSSDWNTPAVFQRLRLPTT